MLPSVKIHHRALLDFSLPHDYEHRQTNISHFLRKANNEKGNSSDEVDEDLPGTSSEKLEEFATCVITDNPLQLSNRLNFPFKVATYFSSPLNRSNEVELNCRQC